MTLTACGVLMPLSLSLSARDNYQVRSVAEARGLPDGTWVTLNGYIIDRIEKDLYLFKDQTGRIELKSIPQRWPQLEYDPQRKAQVYGRLKKKDNNLYQIEVKKVMYLKKCDITG